MLLDELVSAANRHPEAGCFGPWIYYMHDPDRLWCTRSEWVPADSAFSAPGKGSTRRGVGAGVGEYGLCLRCRALLPRRRRSPRSGCSTNASSSSTRTRTGVSGRVAPGSNASRSRRHACGTRSARRSAARRHRCVRISVSATNCSGRRRTSADRNGRRCSTPHYVACIRRFAMDRVGAGSTHRALLWAVNGFVREWSRQRDDPQELAHRRGVLDYILRRFGDCPPEIRALTQAWANIRGAAEAPGSPAG